MLQDIVYSVLAALSLVMAILLLATWLLVDRALPIIGLAFYFTVQIIVFIWLTLATGENPQLNHELFQTLIVYTRMVNVLVLCFCIVTQIQRLWLWR